MNSAFAKVSNLKVNKASKIAITIASSTLGTVRCIRLEEGKQMPSYFLGISTLDFYM